MDMGVYFVTVLGGEPLMYPYLYQMIEEHPHIFFQIYTNGTLLTSEVAQRFTDLGNTLVVISIEGDEKETDAWRGTGVYNRTMEAFENLNKADMIFGTSATVTNKNEPIVSSCDFVDRMIGMGSILQNYFLYVPVNGQADFNLMVTPEQRNHLRKQVLAIRDSRPIFVLDFWNDGPYVCGCMAAGRRYLHINANGDIEPCVYTHVAMDNIKEVKPYYTHSRAEEIFTIRAAEMDAYAERYAALADRIWEDEYLNNKKWMSKIKETGNPLQRSGPAQRGAAVKKSSSWASRRVTLEQLAPQIDAELAKKGHLRMETS
jgi:MoaA/NifB/PqqE/SkfB family radical SAM enzyme